MIIKYGFKSVELIKCHKILIGRFSSWLVGLTPTCNKNMTLNEYNLEANRNEFHLQ